MASPFTYSVDNLFKGQPETVAVSAFAAVGFLVFASSILRLFTSIWVIFLRPGKNLKKYGKWAIVTGATDGIGKAYAKQLARKKINVVLISRTQEKLTEIASELEGKYGIQTKTCAIDLTSSDLASALQPVHALVTELDIGILISNAGMSYPYAQFLHELDSELITKLIRINIEATTALTKLVIPGMLQRKKGAIVNIGSGAATVLPSDPLYAVYAGTKGYVDQFSRTLGVEYKARGIDIQCQAPLYVATKLAKIRRASLTCPSPDTYARAGVAWIGHDPRCTPYWVHSIMWFIVANIPENLMDAIRLSQNLSIRKRALAKEALKKTQ